MPVADLLLTDIGTLYTLEGPAGPRTGPAMEELGPIDDAACAIHEGRVVATGPSRELEEAWEPLEVHSVEGRIATPGLVDPHTHLVFAGDRSDEFERRVRGASYEEIAAEGGGIRSTVRATRETDLETLVADGARRLDRMLGLGTTSAEAKSGYGLDLETERRLLEAIERLDRAHPVDLVPTCLAAHEIPDGWREKREGWVAHLTGEILPALQPLARYCDIFCDVGVYTTDESREILGAARELGYELKLHVDELSDVGGAELAVELGARTADHLCHVSDAGLEALAASDTIPVVLPLTTFYLGKDRYAPARRMIEAGLPVALATDLNPGSSHSESLPLAMTVGCLQMGLSPAEALTAATHNAAWAAGLEEVAGMLVPGRPADLVVWEAGSHREIASHPGVVLAREVYKGGRLVARDGQRTGG